MADVDLGGKITLLDLAQETLPGGDRFIDVAKILTSNKRFPVFTDSHWEEGNQIGGHIFGRDAALPNGDMRSINNGIDSTAGRTDQFTEPISLYEDRNTVDQELVVLAERARPGGGMEFRARKDDQHIRGATIWLGDKMLYASRSVANPNYIDGFTTRRATLAGGNIADNGDATGSSVTSGYLIGWGPGKCALLYPPGGKVNDLFGEEDLGRLMVTGANSKQLLAYVTEFYYRYGIWIHDEQYFQRLANIGTGASNHVDVDLMIELAHNLPDTEGAVWYFNKTGYIQLEQEAKNLGEHILRWVKLDSGAYVLMFKGDIPVKRWDSIKDTEEVVT